MNGITAFGAFHTAISIIAVATGIFALIRDKVITWNNAIGKIYIVTTVATCVTGFFIFHHGGFGKPHVLGILTLIALAIAFVSGNKTRLFGSASPYIETVCYSMSFFFHIIPAITETTTRLPLDAPLASSPDDPNIQMAIGICAVLFMVGAALQIRMIRHRLFIAE